MYLHFAFHRGQDQLGIPAKLPKDLPASPARGSRRIGIRDHGNRLQNPLTLGDRLQHRHSFSTDAQTVGRAFDVAAPEYAPRRSAHRSAYAKSGMRGVRVFPRRARSCHQRILSFHPYTPIFSVSRYPAPAKFAIENEW